MRTIKRHSITLNLAKENKLISLAKAYSKEKQYWLSLFQQEYLASIKNHRDVRDKAIQSKYKSPNHLQARMWKLALQDAADTMDKYWQSLFEKIKRDIHQSTLDDSQRHYIFWILKDYARFAKALESTPLFKDLPLPARKKAIKCLKQKIKKYKKQLPKVKLSRSFLLDDNCYNLFQHEGRQYINIMSLVPRERIAVPLTGNTPIKGNIRVVLKKEKIEVHYTADIKQVALPKNDNVIAVDFGYTEVITDSDGQQYGMGFGQILNEASDHLKIKMQRRNKLHALQKKYAQSSDNVKKKKAKHIAKFNLGTEKLEKTQNKVKAAIQSKINHSYNIFLEKNPNIVISESLSHTFHYGFGRNMNRRLSGWVKGELKERLEFKALAKGFSHKQVNPAYCSQLCLLCGYVDRKNRKGDKFECQNCWYVGHADWVAAMNLRRRYSDPEITRFTPYRAVKEILLQRFHRQLETKKLGTVNGRIPDTAVA
ncbi:MAG TPA: zinc ribbon domain-containing protein [Patescibacteria group bacterium]|nr:zinc ribbon domain-containing protein [Patescibacteria group bacterium]